jgi:ribose/xylose/arabinose/galactoside ABC-type transport system permease subunit
VKASLRQYLPQLGISVLLLLLTLFFASKERLFLSPGTLAQMFKYYSPMAMLGLGMTFIILTGGIDLSVGYGMMLVMFLMAGHLRDHPTASPFVALGMGLGGALLLGGVIGGAVSYARIPAFIVSLAGMVVSYGLTLIISANQSIGDLHPALLWLGKTTFSVGKEEFPIMLFVVVGAYIAGGFLLRRTVFGRHVYAIGSNREAARLSGIPVKRTELIVYLIGSLCVWVAAWMQLGINRTADPKVALSDSLELNAIAIVVIGGTSLSGGRGNVLGTALGALLLSVIFYGLPLINYNEPSHKKIIQGSIILLGAILDVVQKRVAKEA